MKQRQAHRYGLMPIASRLLIAGEILILLALCDFAARLDAAVLAGSQGALLRLSDIGGAVSSAGVILVGSVLFLDYEERREE